MSRHTSRKARWTHVDAREYRAGFGTVRYRAGAWEGLVVYEVWRGEGSEIASVGWQTETTLVGRFKRPRNAMMAVEDKAREILRRHREHVRIAFEE